MTDQKRDAPVYVLAQVEDGQLVRGARSRSLLYATPQLAKTNGRREPTWKSCALVEITWHNGRMKEVVLEMLDTDSGD